MRGDACAVKAVSRSLFTTLEVGLSELFSALVRDLGGTSDTVCLYSASETLEAPVSALYQTLFKD